MAATTNESDEMIVSINVTPLVDVVLVLLVIFMITAPVIYQSAIKVDLPKALSGQNEKHVTLRFSMLKSGGLLLGKDLITMDQVKGAVQQALKDDPTANAVIAADKDLTHGAVIGLIDALKTNGLARVGIAVESPAGGKEQGK